ncbi:MAG: PEGA domain-containing protein [Myxococcota bacterium]
MAFAALPGAVYHRDVRCLIVLLMLTLVGGVAQGKKRRPHRSKTMVSKKKLSKPAESTKNVPKASSIPPANSNSTTPSKRRARQRIAVLELGSLGVSSGMMKNLEMLLQNSIGTMATVDLVSPVDIQIALSDPSAREVAECGGGPRCAVQVGRLVEANTVVFGNIGMLGETFSLNLRAMDVATGTEKARQQATISGNRDLLIPEMRLAAFRLIAPELITGSLFVEIDVEGVEVQIDGQVVGMTPLSKPVEDLTPGKHVVVLKRPGYAEFREEFVIKAFETARLKPDFK